MIRVTQPFAQTHGAGVSPVSVSQSPAQRVLLWPLAHRLCFCTIDSPSGRSVLSAWEMLGSLCQNQKPMEASSATRVPTTPDPRAGFHSPSLRPYRQKQTWRKELSLHNHLLPFTQAAPGGRPRDGFLRLLTARAIGFCRLPRQGSECMAGTVGQPSEVWPPGIHVGGTHGGLPPISSLPRPMGTALPGRRSGDGASGVHQDTPAVAS